MDTHGGLRRGLVTAWAVVSALALVPAVVTGGPTGSEAGARAGAEAGAGSGAGAEVRAGTGTRTGAAAPVTTLVLDKNPDDPTRSKLSVYEGDELRAAYRAGSGLGVEDDCARTKGRLPNGNRRISSRTRTYDGDLVKGYVVHLQDMTCSRGTVTRTEMFVHSETDRDGSRGGTERRRWDGAGDYRSNGCVKLHPADIGEMFRLLDRIGWPTHLRVVS